MTVTKFYKSEYKNSILNSLKLEILYFQINEMINRLKEMECILQSPLMPNHVKDGFVKIINDTYN